MEESGPHTIPLEIDGLTLTGAEREAFAEREAICMFDGLVSRGAATRQATDTVRRMRMKQAERS